MSFRPFLALALALPLSAIAAPQPNWYASVDAGSASTSCLSWVNTSAKCDTSNTSLSLSVGSEVMPGVSVEGRLLTVSSLMDVTATTGATLKVDLLLFATTAAKSFAVNDKLSFPIRAGIFNASSKGTVSSGTLNTSSSYSKTSWTVGLGAEYNFDKSWFAKADYNRYNDAMGDDVDRQSVTTLSLGIGMRF